jgi:sugar-specific transcriptional regulator TrmB
VRLSRWGPASSQAALFDELRKAIEGIGALDDNEAKAYAHALGHGMRITSRDAMRILKCGQPTALSVLQRLASKGFLRAALTEKAVRARRGSPHAFQAVDPRVALKDFVARYEKLQLALDILDEHGDAIAEQETGDEDTWKVPPEEAKEQFCQAIRVSTSCVKMVCNDCSWVYKDGILDALAEASGRGVAVTILAYMAEDGVKHKIESKGLRVKPAAHKNQPFAIIDDKIVYTPVRFGKVSTDFGAHYTSNPYVVQNHIEQFHGQQEAARP